MAFSQYVHFIATIFRTYICRSHRPRNIIKTSQACRYNRKYDLWVKPYQKFLQIWDLLCNQKGKAKEALPWFGISTLIRQSRYRMHFYAETFVVAWYKIVAKKLLLHIREKGRSPCVALPDTMGSNFFWRFIHILI